MKTHLAFAASAAAAILAAGPASAGHFSPENTSFTGVGPFGVAQGQVGGACTMTIKGEVKRKVGKITSATFSACSGGTAPTATGLPWPIKVISSTPDGGEVGIENFGFVGLGAFCGPGTLTVAVSNTQSPPWAYQVPNFPPNCLLAGGWTLTPPVTVKSKH